MTKKILDTHYKRLAKNYDDFLYYSPEFIRTLTSKMVEKLEFIATDTFVDLGCGTGMYLLDILKQVRLGEAIGVDPYSEMLKKIKVNGKIRTVTSDALSFSILPGAYDKILIKEAIHHIEERENFFSYLFKRLRKGGILLLVHVPPEVDYPLFQKALDRCKNWHAKPDELSVQLKNAGFYVERDFIRYKHSIPKDKYFTMVQNCYMSALTSLEKYEIKAGLIEMERKYQGQDILQFIDHFDYLKGSSFEEWLDIDSVLGLFSENRKEGIKKYKEFMRYGVYEEVDQFYSNKRHGSILGDNPFKDWIQDKYITKDKKADIEIREKRQIQGDKRIKIILKEVCNQFKIDKSFIYIVKRGEENLPRLFAISLSRDLSGLSFSEIASKFDIMSYKTVASSNFRLKEKISRNKKLGKIYKKL